jgi:hypothetical protein
MSGTVALLESWAPTDHLKQLWVQTIGHQLAVYKKGRQLKSSFGLLGDLIWLDCNRRVFSNKMMPGEDIILAKFLDSLEDYLALKTGFEC